MTGVLNPMIVNKVKVKMPAKTRNWTPDLEGF
jgi:hypothetical protein